MGLTDRRQIARPDRRGQPSWQHPSPRPSAADGLRNTVVTMLGSGILAIFLQLICEYLALRGVISLRLAWIVLVFAWAIGSIGIAASEIVWGQRIRYRVPLGFAASVILAAALFGLDWSVSAIAGSSALLSNINEQDRRAQIAEMDELNTFLYSATKNNFYYDVTLRDNIARIARNVQRNKPPDGEAMAGGGQGILSSRRIQINGLKHAVIASGNEHVVSVLSLPTVYTDMKDTLSYFASSDKLPSAVVTLLSKLGRDIDSAAAGILDCLGDKYQKSPKLFLDDLDLHSPDFDNVRDDCTPRAPHVRTDMDSIHAELRRNLEGQ